MAGYSARATLHDGPLTGYETKVTIGGTPEGALLLFYERRLILFALYIRDDSGPESRKAAVAAAAAHFQNKGLLPLASLKDEDKRSPS